MFVFLMFVWANGFPVAAPYRIREEYNGKKIFIPKDEFFRPHKKFLSHHRKYVFESFAQNRRM